jgi:uncharacterized membrane protein YqhA
MKEIIEKTKNLVLIAVFSSLIASAAGFVWGFIKTLAIIINFILSYGKDPFAAIALIEIMDIFLIATFLFIFSMGMYELFIEKIELPEWLIINNLHDLKVKLSSVIILVMAITFLKHLVEWTDPQGTLYFGIAVAAVSGTLIAFGYYGGKD